MSVKSEPIAGSLPRRRALSGPRTRLRHRGRLGWWLAVSWLGLVVLAAALASWLPLPDPDFQDYNNIRGGPSLSHLLGSDALGRDMLSRLVFGARTSLLVALTSVIGGALVGGMIGVVAGYARGFVERVVLALTDVLLAFPGLVLVIGIVAVFGSSIPNLVVGLIILSLPGFIRLARANTLEYASRDFVTAARAYGARPRRIVAREILPNVALPVAAYAFILVGVFIVIGGGLSFLGLGVPPPTADWGAMIAEGRDDLLFDPWESLAPAAVMFVTVVAINYLGQSVRERREVKESSL